MRTELNLQHTSIFKESTFRSDECCVFITTPSHFLGERKIIPVRTMASQLFLAMLDLDPVKELNFFFQYENNFKN